MSAATYDSAENGRMLWMDWWVLLIGVFLWLIMSLFVFRMELSIL